MIAEVISIGDELTSGQRLDTNSQWLAQQLGDLGVTTLFHTTVADDLAANVRAFSEAVDRADIVVASGGMGPTADDLTRDAIAAAAGVELELHAPSLEHIRGLFTRHNRAMPERNQIQAMFPRGSKPIPNATGTAPGIDMLVAGSADDHFARVFALPGVPAEMREMFKETVAPAIVAMQPQPCVVSHYRIKCFGAGESQIEAMVPDLIARKREPLVGITVHAATITLRITTSGANAEDCRAIMQPTIDTIRETLGDLVFGEEDDELQDVVIRMLRERNQSLCSVECGSQGLLAQWLAEASGEHGPYHGGLVLSKSPTSDVASLVEEERAKANVDFALGVGPFPEDVENTTPAPQYYVALATPERVLTFEATLVSHASIWKPRAAKQALNLLRLHLKKKAQNRSL